VPDTNTRPAPRLAPSSDSMAAFADKFGELAAETGETFKQIETIVIVLEDRLSTLRSSLSPNNATEVAFLQRLLAIADGHAGRGREMASAIEIGMMNLPEAR
jgi:hypothetical protein